MSNKKKAIDQYKELISIFLDITRRDLKYNLYEFTTEFEEKSHALLVFYSKVNAYTMVYTRNGDKMNLTNSTDIEVVANVFKSIFLVADAFKISIPETILSKTQTSSDLFSMIPYFLGQYRNKRNETDYIDRVLKTVLNFVMPKPEQRLGFLRTYTYYFENLNSTF